MTPPDSQVLACVPDPQPDDHALPVAAVLAGPSDDTDALLSEMARRATAQGWRVRGLVMHRPDGPDACGPMWLHDLHTGVAYCVSQELGSGSQACRADPDGFAQASAVLRQALDEHPDLVICNRFGGLEAGGGGFSAELLALMAAGIPLLTAVQPRHLGAWQRFTGDTASLIGPDAQAVWAWCARHRPALAGPAGPA